MKKLAEPAPQLPSVTLSEMKDMIQSTCEKLSNNMCYPVNIRSTFQNFGSIQINFDSLHTMVKSICDANLLIKVDPEGFYSDFMSKITLNSEIFFPSLEYKFRGVLATKLQDVIFNTIRGREKSKELPAPSKISNKEHDGLQNLSGYLVKNLIKKNKLKKKEYNKIAVQILSSTIVDSYEDQPLIQVQSRGGLTAVNKDVQSLVIVAEEKFRSETVSFSSSRKIDIERIISDLLREIHVKSHLNNILEESGVGQVDEDVPEKVLSEIFRLFLKVRSHSLSRDIIGKYRQKVKNDRITKGLRKSLKKNEEAKSDSKSK